MNRDNARARVHRAKVELDASEQQLAAHWQPWRERIGRHRLSLLIGGGLLGGLALAMVPPKRWARVGAGLFGGSAWLVRSALGPAVLGALWTNISRSARTPATACPVAPSA
jgi:hypothetical protein